MKKYITIPSTFLSELNHDFQTICHMCNFLSIQAKLKNKAIICWSIFLVWHF